MDKRALKSENFIRLAEQRINNIFEQFRKLGNLSNRRNYEFNEEQVKKIFSEINKIVRKTKAQFSQSNYPKSSKFKF